MKSHVVLAVLRFFAGRAPRGARGLKYLSPGQGSKKSERRAPRGARGLKSVLPNKTVRDEKSRAPRGARGLKFKEDAPPPGQIVSRPARGAWIEIAGVQGHAGPWPVAPREGRGD